MKKIMLLWITALIAVGMTACSKEEKGNNETENGVGEVRLKFGFGKGTKTRAVSPSSAKPTTTWKDNIKDLMILFVEDGKVKDAREVLPLPTTENQAAQIFTFTGIKASATGKTYDIYVLANTQQTGSIKAEKRSGGTWNMSSCAGSRIKDLLMKLVVNSDYQPQGTTEDGSTGYSQPAEVFVAKRSGITIAPDISNDLTVAPFQLERIISMMRVRIDKSKNGNQVVDFTDANTSFRIRRATASINPLKEFTRGGIKDVLYTKGAFETTEPNNGYEGGNILSPTENITLWKDILILPGGSVNTGAEKFDIVLTGKAPAGYVPLGKDAGLNQAAEVAWTAAVSTSINPNFILEINLTLERAGIWLDDPENPGGIPEVGEYGNVEASIQLIPWGSIISEDIPV